VAEVGGQHRLHGRAEQDPVDPAGHRPLVEVGERPRLPGLALQLRALEGAQHHHLGRGPAVLDEPGRVQAVEDRHAQVDDDDVGLQLPGHGDRVGPVAALADDLEAGLLQQVPQRRPEAGVVVGQQHPGAGRQVPELVGTHAGLPPPRAVHDLPRPFALPISDLEG
jgi:hypothetical protein